MKHFVLPVALMLTACGGFDSKQDFLKDVENQNKYNELSAKHENTPDCDKLGKLYEFTQQKTPTNDDLAQILPFLGLTAKDATDIDKVYKINYDIIDKYNCADNVKQILSERTKYCEDKYYDETVLETALYLPYRAVATITVFPAVITPILGIGALPFFLVGCKSDDFSDTLYHPGNCRKKLDCEKYLFEGADYTGIDKEKLKKNLETKVKNILPQIPEWTEDLAHEFTINEIIMANNTILGTYDGNCEYSDAYDRFVETTDYIYSFGLCDSKTKKVTRLNAAHLLQGYCLYNTVLPGKNDKYVCLCYAHDTHQKVTYKNVIYIYEKGEIPPSKQAEFKQIRQRCEQKVERRNKTNDKKRYGETSIQKGE